jgi:hypothetical protein
MACGVNEVARVEGFRGWRIVSGQEMRTLRRSHPTQVSMGNIVAVLTMKRDPSGNQRELDVARKLRVAISDPTSKDSVDVKSYSPCVDPMSNIIITAVAPSLRAEQTSIDVGGAYWHGTPPSLDDGGRVIFAPVPAWMAGLGAGGYQAFDRHGRSNFLRILGNMPGRRDAGRIWHSCLDGFLRAYGLRQQVSFRRVWAQDSPLGIIIYHDHVDDSRLTTTATGALQHFHRAWALRFGESWVALAERSEDSWFPCAASWGASGSSWSRFAVSRTSRTAFSVAMSLSADDGSGRSIGPLPGALCRGHHSPAPTPRPPPERVRRGDGTFGLGLFQCYTDSPHGNADDGLGYAGFAIITRGEGGALGWKVMLPPSGFDSTAAAELHATTVALKYTVAIRTLQSELELDVAPSEPTPLYTNAQAVIDGSSMGRMTRATRWLAAKYAMVRWRYCVPRHCPGASFIRRPNC